MSSSATMSPTVCNAVSSLANSMDVLSFGSEESQMVSKRSQLSNTAHNPDAHLEYLVTPNADGILPLSERSVTLLMHDVKLFTVWGYTNKVFYHVIAQELMTGKQDGLLKLHCLTALEIIELAASYKTVQCATKLFFSALQGELLRERLNASQKFTDIQGMDAEKVRKIFEIPSTGSKQPSSDDFKSAKQ